ncbi:MAG TPA: hypothetical protein VGH28_15545 [Polyangiaceae bacterium]|jgi:hypothetical protein
MRGAFVMLVATASCQLVWPIREETDDADASDATTLPDASDAEPDAFDDAGDASDAPVNLVANASFEDGLLSAGCGSSWTFVNGVTSKQPSSIAHSGQHSCEICVSTPQGSVSQIIPLGLDAGASFGYGAWIAPVPPDSSEKGVAQLSIHTVLPDGGGKYTSNVVSAISDGGWVQLFQTETVAQPIDSVTIQIAHGLDAGCVLVDDAFVYVE